MILRVAGSEKVSTSVINGFVTAFNGIEAGFLHFFAVWVRIHIGTRRSCLTLSYAAASVLTRLSTTSA